MSLFSAPEAASETAPDFVKNITILINSLVETIGIDSTSKIAERLMLNLMTSDNASVNGDQHAKKVEQQPEVPSVSSANANHVGALASNLLTPAVRSVQQVARPSRGPGRPRKAIKQAPKVKRYQSPKSLFDCRESLENGVSLIARFRNDNHDYVIQGILGTTAYVPDGYVTSRGIKTTIDLKAAHHFWKVVGEVPEPKVSGLPMVRGRSYQPQAPKSPNEHNLVPGSLLAEKATGALVFVKTIFDGEVAVEDENASPRWIEVDQVTNRFDLVGHSADFEEEVALRA